MSDQPIGPVLDGLGVTIDLADGDLVEDAVVLAKVVDADGDVTLSISTNEGQSWLEQLGLVAAARDLLRNSAYETRDDD